MQKDQKKTPKPIHSVARVKLVFAFALFIVIGFVFRLLYLQVYAGHSLREHAYAQRRSERYLPPRRGNIYDRENRPLAVSVTVNTCYVSPREIKDSAKEETAELLSYLLRLEKEEILSILKGDRAYVALKTKLSQEEVDQIRSAGLAGVGIEREAQRFYPHNDLLAQSLGVVNRDGEGIYGLEAQYDDLLKGLAGRTRSSLDARGNIIPTESVETYASVEGQNIRTTIDLDAQQVVSEELKKGLKDFQADATSAILMDPNTGEILAMDHYPSFNANAPRNPILLDGETKWEDLEEGQQLEALYSRWKNPMVSELYEPGSVFKILTSAISLESGANQASSTYLCEGTMEIAPGIVISCWSKDHPHGKQTLEEALNNSCNPAFVQVVREMGRDTFYSYLKSLRMGETSQVDLPGETASLFPETPEDLSDVRMATMSYGYGVSVTPLEMMTAANTVINGGYYRRPHLFKESTDASGKVLSSYQESSQEPLFSQQTVETMRNYLYSTSVTNQAKVMRIDGVKIGSKSGTAHMLEDGDYVGKTMASFYSFYPVDQPKYALFVLAENPKTSLFGGVVSGEISARIWERLVGSLGKEDGEDQGQRLPELKDKSAAEAADILLGLGLEPSLVGDMNPFSKVGSQHPEAGQILEKGAKVDLYPDEGKTSIMPNLTGKSRDQVQTLLDRANLAYTLEGEGERVTRQELAPGQTIKQDTTIRLYLEEDASEEESGE